MRERKREQPAQPSTRTPRATTRTSGAPAVRSARARVTKPPAHGPYILAVLTTGIYCVPGCKARKPLPENVRYYGSPAAARAAGFRACLRCRPDERFGGGQPERDAIERIVAALFDDPAAFADPRALAKAGDLGVTKLHALLREHYHVTPAALLLRARIARAATELVGGTGVADAAFAAGFATLSTFHERFRRATGLTPGGYRELGTTPAFTLVLPADYLAEPTLRSWGRDPLSLTERVDGRRVLRALQAPAEPSGAALLEIELGQGVARCRVETTSGVAAAPETIRAAHAVALRALGLLVDPLPFERRARRDAAQAALLARRRGLRIPMTADPFEALVWAVLGQQINLAFAFTLRRRLVELAGTPAPRGLFAHPLSRALAALDPADLVARQLSRAKATTLVELARAVENGELPLDALALASAGRIEETLVARRGVGPWTAQYVLLRGYGFADCVPAGDAGLALALERFHTLDERPDAARTRALMAPFAPFRSLATFHLWMTLGDVP